MPRMTRRTRGPKKVYRWFGAQQTVSVQDFASFPTSATNTIMTELANQNISGKVVLQRMICQFSTRRLTATGLRGLQFVIYQSQTSETGVVLQTINPMLNNDFEMNNSSILGTGVLDVPGNNWNDTSQIQITTGEVVCNTFDFSSKRKLSMLNNVLQIAIASESATPTDDVVEVTFKIRILVHF